MKSSENPSGARRARVLNVVTSSLSVRCLCLIGQCEYLAKRGYDVWIVSSPGEELRKAQNHGVRTVPVSMEREISPWKDFLSFCRLLGVIWRLRPDIINVGTPKAGLLGGIAGWVCRVPCRYYTLHGLRCETTRGLKRRVLLLSERIACACAHQVICVSESLRRKAIELGVVDDRRTALFGGGSCSGVDAERFAPTGDALRRAEHIRGKLGIPPQAPVVGFVGRLTRDKGVPELVEAFLALRLELPEAQLLLVGETEEGDPLPAEVRCAIEDEAGILHVGLVDNPAEYYHVMDVLALPTYREGFGTVVLEAHAAGKPVVATRATGVVDAVIDGVTGILVPVGDVRALTSALMSVIRDRNFGEKLGSAGRMRVMREFRQEIVWGALEQEYSRVLGARGFCAPMAAGTNENAGELRATMAAVR